MSNAMTSKPCLAVLEDGTHYQLALSWVHQDNGQDFHQCKYCKKVFLEKSFWVESERSKAVLEALDEIDAANRKNVENRESGAYQVSLIVHKKLQELRERHGEGKRL